MFTFGACAHSHSLGHWLTHAWLWYCWYGMISNRIVEVVSGITLYAVAWPEQKSYLWQVIRSQSFVLSVYTFLFYFLHFMISSLQTSAKRKPKVWSVCGAHTYMCALNWVVCSGFSDIDGFDFQIFSTYPTDMFARILATAVGKPSSRQTRHGW